ncbi:MAG: hypothetical protein HKN92_03240 [Chitinophagales bacterium]|nr:hypothetical protein [Chitinophagales bacterium]
MKVMIRLKTIVVVLFATISCQITAQESPTAMFNPHTSAAASHVFPGKIGDGFKVVEVTLPTIHLSVGNDAMSFNELKSLLTDPVISESYISNTINSLNDANHVFLNTSIQLLGVGFNLRNEKKGRIASFSFSVVDKAVSGITFPKKIFEILYEGNSQYAGETVDFAPMAADVLYYRDIALGASMPLSIQGPLSKMELTPGIRLRYLQGIASMNLAKADFSMFTEADGKYIHFDFDYELNTSMPNGVNEILGGTGKGVGMDLGLNLKVNEMITADIAINDVGFINFDKDPVNQKRQGDYRYEGIELNLWEADVSQWSTIDTIKENIKANKTYDPYKVNLQPKLSFLGSFTLSPMMSKKQMKFFQHSIYFSYTQGFSNKLDRSTMPLIGLGYVYSLANIFNIGPSVTLGGHKDFAMGIHTSVKGGPFKFAIGSGDISPLLMKNNGKGADIYTSFALSF